MNKHVFGVGLYQGQHNAALTVLLFTGDAKRNQFYCLLAMRKETTELLLNSLNGLNRQRYWYRCSAVSATGAISAVHSSREQKVECQKTPAKREGSVPVPMQRRKRRVQSLKFSL